MNDDIRRSMPLFPMRIITKLTELTPRQIRYYEQQGLIQPSRTQGNQRLFSFHDVDRLLEIRSLLEKKVNIAGIKEMLRQGRSGEAIVQEPSSSVDAKAQQQDMSDEDLHKLLKRQLSDSASKRNHLTRGDLARFFH
ncbi:MerR family transcriptional regulator [Mechercharimyces sp. CAU 1602]|uniref:MerR family transcriptional regulator n=1 Tax=Mechercharimyces sp. CAU 1602 TaxID=2973933 RepID=UPI002163104A|nr:MerR family transcriptional regulator [Mechercharimyces sp. CAU 1602]MCS1351201.1 MerR family transcriptional regulator [Mechercharimyces sp. CAU 1602]